MVGRRLWVIVGCGTAAAALLAAPAAGARPSQHTFLVSVARSGSSAGGGAPDVSFSGRRIVFASESPDIVPGDTNRATDVFVRDRRLHRTVRVSLLPDGSQAPFFAFAPAMSGDGRVVAFESNGAFVPGDDNGRQDIYVRDTRRHRTLWASATVGGTAANGDADFPALSFDGNLLAFTSSATDLVATPDANGALRDVYLRDLRRGRTRRVSVTSAGVQVDADSTFDSMSGDGRTVCWSSDGAFVAGDRNGLEDVYCRDRTRRRTFLVSATPTGRAGNAPSGIESVSANGRWVAFQSAATDLEPGGNPAGGVFVRDLRTGRVVEADLTNRGVPASGDGGRLPRLSGDGRFVIFEAVSRNLRPKGGPPLFHVYVRDRDADGDGVYDEPGAARTTLVDRGPNGPGNVDASDGRLSGNGRWVVFTSHATNLDPHHSNPDANLNVFARGPLR